MFFREEPLTLNAIALASKLRSGSAALFPTDTLPALAAYPDFASQLWKIKQRPLEKPLILMGAKSQDLFDFLLPNALEDAACLAKRYWPGALTMVLPADGPVVEALNPGELNLGIRVPACESALELLSQSGPLATTSANLAGEPPSLTAEDASKYFPDLPLLGPTPWPVVSGQASTVILWRKPGCWQLLRNGAVIIESLEG